MPRTALPSPAAATGFNSAVPVIRGASYGWVVLAAGFCVHLCLGTVNAWGNIGTYATSYLRAHGDDSATYTTTFWVYGAANAAQAAALILSGALQRRVGIRLTCMYGAVVAGCATMLGAAAIRVSLLLFVLTYGVLFGCGVGLAYACPMAAAMQWMPDRKGVCSGVITFGFGLGAFCANFAATTFLNPHGCEPVCDGELYACGGDSTNSSTNVSAPQPATSCDAYFPAGSDVVARVPELFLYFGAAYTVVGCVFASLVTPPTPGDMYVAIASSSEERAAAPAPSRPSPAAWQWLHSRLIRPRDDPIDGPSSSSSSASWNSNRTDPRWLRQPTMWRRMWSTLRAWWAWCSRSVLTTAYDQANDEVYNQAYDEAYHQARHQAHDHSSGLRISQSPVRTPSSPSEKDESPPMRRPPPAGEPAWLGVDQHGCSIGCSHAGHTPSAPRTSTSAARSARKRDGEMDLRDLVTSVVGWQLWWGFFAVQLGGTYVMGQYKAYGQQQSWSTDEFEQLVASLMAAACAVGSVSHGIAADWAGFAPVLALNAAAQAAVLWPFGLPAAVSSRASWAAWCCAAAFCFGGNFATFPAACADVAGQRNFGANYSFVFSGFGAQSLLLGVISSAAPAASFGTMTFACGWASAAAAGNAVTLLRLRCRRPHRARAAPPLDAEAPKRAPKSALRQPSASPPPDDAAEAPAPPPSGNTAASTVRRKASESPPFRLVHPYAAAYVKNEIRRSVGASAAAPSPLL